MPWQFIIVTELPCIRHKIELFNRCPKITQVPLPFLSLLQDFATHQRKDHRWLSLSGNVILFPQIAAAQSNPNANSGAGIDRERWKVGEQVLKYSQILWRVHRRRLAVPCGLARRGGWFPTIPNGILNTARQVFADTVYRGWWGWKFPVKRVVGHKQRRGFGTGFGEVGRQWVG